MQLAMHMVTIEDLMPREHFLRKLEAALDLSFVYEETAPLYSKKLGRQPIDPVIIVKYLLVGFLYGIPSERQIERRVQTDIALRWYLGLDLFDRVPDHSTVSQLRRRKPSFRKVFRRLFEEVVGQCIEKGLVSGRVVGADSTHVRANAPVRRKNWWKSRRRPAFTGNGWTIMRRKGWRNLSGEPESAAKSGQSRSNETTAAPTSASAAQTRSRVI